MDLLGRSLVASGETQGDNAAFEDNTTAVSSGALELSVFQRCIFSESLASNYLVAEGMKRKARFLESLHVAI